MRFPLSITPAPSLGLYPTVKDSEALSASQLLFVPFGRGCELYLCLAMEEVENGGPERYMGPGSPLWGPCRTLSPSTIWKSLHICSDELKDRKVWTFVVVLPIPTLNDKL